jgi:preprotein translocase subunit SecB
MAPSPGQTSKTRISTMSDLPNLGPDAPSGEPPLTIQIQYIKDLSFENPLAPRSFQSLAQQPNIDLNIQVKTRQLEGRTYEVALVINADARSPQSESIFMLELVYAGVVTLSADVPQEAYGPMLLIEMPRMIFPFARAIVASTTREAGFPPLQISPVDFVSLYRRQQEEAARQGGPAPGDFPAGGNGEPEIKLN